MTQPPRGLQHGKFVCVLRCPRSRAAVEAPVHASFIRIPAGGARAVLGSVASEVLSRSTVPILLLRADIRPTSAVRRVLVPVDRSAGRALGLGASFYFGQHIDPEWDAAAVAGARRYVDDLVEHLRERDVSAAPEQVRPAPVAAAS